MVATTARPGSLATTARPGSLATAARPGSLATAASHTPQHDHRFDVALCEEVLIGALLYGDPAALRSATEGIAWTDEGNAELAEALLDYAEGGGDFRDLYSLITFLCAMGLARTQSAREWMEDAMQTYRDWRSGLWQALPQPVRGTRQEEAEE